jgi:hypothetical protein
MRTFSRRQQKLSASQRNANRRARRAKATAAPELLGSGGAKRVSDWSGTSGELDHLYFDSGGEDGEGALDEAYATHGDGDVLVAAPCRDRVVNQHTDADRSPGIAAGEAHSVQDRSRNVGIREPPMQRDRSTNRDADRSPGGAAGEAQYLVDRSGNVNIMEPPIHTDQSTNNKWAALSPKTKNACILADWQANKGKTSDNAMEDLVENVIPQLDPDELPKWRQVPGLIFGADGYRPPIWHEFIVCKTCGVTKDVNLDVSHCPWCTTRDTTADSWVSQGCSIMELSDIVASWFRDSADAAALLAHLLEPEVESSMSHSTRARTYYDLMYSTVHSTYPYTCAHIYIYTYIYI